VVTSVRNEIETEIDAQSGDYIIYPSHNPDGYYPCKREDFLARYSLVENNLPNNAPEQVRRDNCTVWKAKASVQAL
jgi:glyoxylase-like metal-dependent hydrolase (beta-lactamase superfamily II)